MELSDCVTVSIYFWQHFQLCVISKHMNNFHLCISMSLENIQGSEVQLEIFPERWVKQCRRWLGKRRKGPATPLLWANCSDVHFGSLFPVCKSLDVEMKRLPLCSASHFLLLLFLRLLSPPSPHLHAEHCLILTDNPLNPAYSIRKLPFCNSPASHAFASSTIAS